MACTPTLTGPAPAAPTALTGPTGTVAGPMPRRVDRDRTTPVLPGPDDWCLTADALAALAWADGAELAARVGDADLAALYGAGGAA